VGLSGHVALVTAAAGTGIGRAIARRLAADGANVVVTDRHEQRAQKVADEIAAASGVETMAIAFDVCERGRVGPVIDQAVARFGKVDILVNNAGVNDMTHLFHETPTELWDRDTVANYLTPADLCRKLIPAMIEQRWGVIVNILSQAAASGGGPREGGYAAGKAALAALTKLIATEYAGIGIRSNAIVPGVVWDERGSMLRLLPQEYWDEKMKSVPVGRWGHPDELAGVAAFLCSDDASFVHGTIIEASGGMPYWMNPLTDWSAAAPQD
jgi:3-oxoacyl-[acyl-carrier protein] reductase